MSSVLRSKVDLPSDKTKFLNITTPSYYDNDREAFVPIPFTVNNGVLDINIQDNIVADLFNSPEDFYFDQYLPAMFRVKQMGGLKPITSLGPNLTEFLEFYLGGLLFNNNTITNLKIEVAPVMTKIQSTLIEFPTNSPPFFGFPTEDNNSGVFFVGPMIQNGTGSSQGFSATKPSGSEYVFGSGNNDNYRTSWVFKTPLTVSYLSDGNGPYYFTFNTVFDSAWPFFPGEPYLP